MSEFQPIGSFAKVRRGASPRPINNPDFFGGDVGWVRISDVTQRNKKFLRKTQQYLSPLGQSRSLRVDAGDLIMSICATVGKPMIVDMPACIHDGFVQIYDIQNANTEYLYYLLQFHEKDFEKRGQPGTQVNLNATIVESEVVFIPSLSQQQKIAKILSTVDKLIEKTQALIDKYTSIKQGMMADLFTRGIDMTTGDTPNSKGGKLRPSVEDAPELYKQTELGWVLKEWEVGLLGDHLKRIEQGWSPDCETEPANTGQWGVLKTTAVVWEGYNSLANKALPEGLNPRLEYEVNSGDVLMTRAGPGNRVGVVAYVNSTQNRLILSDKLYRMVPNESLNKEYLSLFLSSAFVQSQLNATKTGLAESQSNISQEIVRKIMAIIPHLDEQNLVVEIIKSMNKKIDAEKKYLRKLSVQKKGLMQDLLTGRVKVQ